MDQKTEAEIVQRVIKGDRQAYALLIDEYKTSIYNLAYRMTRDLQDAEDLAQEAFLRTYEFLDRYDTSRCFRNWLYTISLNIIRNHLKKNVRLRALPADENPILENMPASEEYESFGDQHEKLEACMQKLPIKIRELIILRFYQGLSFQTIAEITGSSQSAVKMRIYRGLEKLKGLIQKNVT